MHQLPALPYDYAALEPYLDAETMRLHHGKHHQAYIDKLNEALSEYPTLAAEPIEDLLKDLNRIPEDIRQTVRNHGGGHANHSLLWLTLKPAEGDALPAGDIKEAIDDAFGSFDDFKNQFQAAALGQFGSGWAWLCQGESGLTVMATANQDSPLSAGHVPLLGVDVWEHAYYLKYQNRRAEYLENFFKVINWEKVNQLFLS